MLTINRLKKSFGNYPALVGLDMQIDDGALYGLIGPNGAGKTTTIKIVTGLMLPEAGQVWLDGIDILKHSGRQKPLIGYVPDYFGAYDNLKVTEYMEFFASCYQLDGLKARTRCQMLLEQLGLGERAEAYVDGLSRGMKQRLGLARALIHDPKLLIMDEPTAGMDPRSRMEFKAIIKELNGQGKTVLLSSHLLSELSELCSYIGVIEQGKILLEGSIAELSSRINVSNPLLITVAGQRDGALKLLKEHRLVQTLAINGDEFRVTFAGTQAEEAVLLRQLVEAGVAVRGFVREKSGLEALFMQITEHPEEKVVFRNEYQSDL